MRFRRHSYDKPWRCPGWAGGGWSYPSKKRNICEGGSFARVWYYYKNPFVEFKFHKCSKCGTIAIPFITRWLDPTWWSWKIRYWVRDSEIRRWWKNHA